MAKESSGYVKVVHQDGSAVRVLKGSLVGEGPEFFVVDTGYLIIEIARSSVIRIERLKGQEAG